MIIVRIRGGLGNQLFQYALGRHLAIINHGELRLDLTDTFINLDRPYHLDKFRIVANIATDAEIKTLSGRPATPFSKFMAQLIKPVNPTTYVKEKSLHYDRTIPTLKPPIYLNGYWQSEKYFKPIGDQIRRESTLKTKPTGLNQSLVQQIQTTRAVSLHVRRGDYVSNKIVNMTHITTPLEYYQKAVEFIAKKISNPHFYIFSDDAAWTRANLKLPYPTTYITHNQGAPAEDLRLMSACRHFIIANSTFSWWGAWLSTNPNKIVVAPKKWFRQNNTKAQDLIPESWLKL